METGRRGALEAVPAWPLGRMSAMPRRRGGIAGTRGLLYGLVPPRSMKRLRASATHVQKNHHPASRSFDRHYRGSPQRLAEGARWPPRRTTVPDSHRTAPQHRRRRVPRSQTRRDRCRTMPVVSCREAPPARPPAQLRDVPASSWSRHCGHRAVAGTRRHPLDAHLSPRGHDHQAASTRSRVANLDSARPLPTHRLAAGVLGGPVIMPTCASVTAARSPPPSGSRRVRHPPCRHSPGVGIGPPIPMSG